MREPGEARTRTDNDVPKEGLEPSRPFGRRILSPLRLPFRHFGQALFPAGNFATVSFSNTYAPALKARLVR